LKVCFYVAYPYYFPHFLPIGAYFKAEGSEVIYVLSDQQNSENMEMIAQENSVTYTFDRSLLFDDSTDVVFFANPFSQVDKVKGLTLFLEHGIGTKSTSFFSFIEYVDIYLVEGSHKERYLKEHYPQMAHKVKRVGFSKFDPIVNFSKEQKVRLFQTYGLDIKKKTILYAPTFFPSSIERMADDFPEAFKAYNIIVKPHYLTYERSRYKGQREKLSIWNTYANCVVAPLSAYNIVPFLAIADVMISDESSAMFEFAALNKPVVSNQYFKLRWSYYLMPWKLKKRIDQSKAQYRVIFDEAFSYKETLTYTQEALDNPDKKAKERLAFAKEICGVIDGKVSERIYAVVEERLSQ